MGDTGRCGKKKKIQDARMPHQPPRNTRQQRKRNQSVHRVVAPMVRRGGVGSYTPPNVCVFSRSQERTRPVVCRHAVRCPRRGAEAGSFVATYLPEPLRWKLLILKRDATVTQARRHRLHIVRLKRQVVTVALHVGRAVQRAARNQVDLQAPAPPPPSRARCPPGQSCAAARCGYNPRRPQKRPQLPRGLAP